MILQQAQRLKGVKIATWISGGYNNEDAVNIGGINFVTLKGLCAYNCSLNTDTLMINDISVSF